MNVFGSHASLIVHLLSFSRSDPVLFPYQSRFNSDLSPFFLSLALGKEGRSVPVSKPFQLRFIPLLPLIGIGGGRGNLWQGNRRVA